MTAPLTPERLAQMAEREAKATPWPWWDNSYNTAFSGHGEAAKEIFSIPDHPQGDFYTSKQISEKSSWYRESEANKDFAIHARTDLPDLLESHRELVEALKRASTLLRVALEFSSDSDVVARYDGSIADSVGFGYDCENAIDRCSAALRNAGVQL